MQTWFACHATHQDGLQPQRQRHLGVQDVLAAGPINAADTTSEILAAFSWAVWAGCKEFSRLGNATAGWLLSMCRRMVGHGLAKRRLPSAHVEKPPARARPRLPAHQEPEILTSSTFFLLSFLPCAANLQRRQQRGAHAGAGSRAAALPYCAGPRPACQANHQPAHHTAASGLFLPSRSLE